MTGFPKVAEPKLGVDGEGLRVSHGTGFADMLDGMRPRCGPEPSPDCGDRNCLWHYGTNPDGTGFKGLLGADDLTGCADDQTFAGTTKEGIYRFMGWDLAAPGGESTSVQIGSRIFVAHCRRSMKKLLRLIGPDRAPRHSAGYRRHLRRNKGKRHA